ncbi:hypothetical protein E5Q_05618 [Mixia osmundae IAM 14324]|uniref:phosphatidylserine decarboxylase n=1 Tax=Mixia osmundae (strain CBS 9802 / IAM 14324 / JCM 22182 / KY 12970) TaxID=764103 RepID=G7E7X0_MIXOS|nr:hypothetical protein E5Q_05618 [Mixia osmundae IAM 14324]
MAPPNLTHEDDNGEHTMGAIDQLVESSHPSADQSGPTIHQPTHAIDEHHHGWLKKLVPGVEHLAVKEDCGNFVRRRDGSEYFEPMPLYVRLSMHLLFVSVGGHTALLKTKRLEEKLKQQSIRQGELYDSPEGARAAIDHFVKDYSLESSLDTLLDPDLDSYKNFNEFFSRKLKPDARPIAAPSEESVITSAADCRLTVFQSITKAKQFWVKGQQFDFANLVESEAITSLPAFKNADDLSIAIFRLAPADYHRFHAPVSASLGPTTEIQGAYYTVNPQAIKEKFDVFTANRRDVVVLDTKSADGSSTFPIAFVAVGAMLVGAIRWSAKEGEQVKKGEELGWFQYGGSTVIAVFPSGSMKFDDDLVKNSEDSVETEASSAEQIANRSIRITHARDEIINLFGSISLITTRICSRYSLGQSSAKSAHELAKQANWAAMAPPTLTHEDAAGEHTMGAIDKLVESSGKEGDRLHAPPVHKPVMAVESHESHYFWLQRLVPGLQYLAVREDCGNFVRRRDGTQYFEPMPLYVRLSMHLLFVSLGSRTSLLKTRRLEDRLQQQSIRQGELYDSPEGARMTIDHFVRDYALEPTLDTLLKPDLDSYKNFNEFFSRKLKPDARPIASPSDERIVTSAADCRLTVYPSVDQAKQFWVKGEEFNFANLVDSDAITGLPGFKDGDISIAIFRLAPADYHRFHAPLSGRLGPTTEIKGAYYTVNPQAIRENFDVFTANRRDVMVIETPCLDGASTFPVAFVAIGAMLVGAICWSRKEGDQVKKGDELGWFQYGGSTVIAAFPSASIKFDDDLLINSHESVETEIKMGERIAVKI